MEKRVKIQGQDTVGNWHFSADVKFSREEKIADILRDAKGEYGQFWQLSDKMQVVVREEIDNVKVVNHKHNGRVQRFSVYVPKELLSTMQKAYDQESLFQDYIYDHYAV